MSTAVFVGPSIRGARLREIPDVHITKPIRRGDLKRFAEFQTLIVLDGEFNQSLSVSPKEILGAIDRGQTVIGASSMGALRASELDSFGMIGVGWVYHRFALASVRRDDDVALIYSPLDFRPSTVPMVNVQYWMECAIKTGSISRKEGAAVIKASRAIFYADRVESRLLHEIGQLLGQERMQKLLDMAGGIPDIKEIDGLEAIEFGRTHSKKRQIQTT